MIRTRHFCLSLLPLLLIGSSVKLQAQAETFVFEGNNFRWTQRPDGSYFYHQEEGSTGLEVPIGSQNHTMFGSAFWVGGLNPDNELKITFRRFCQEPEESCEENWGPLHQDGTPGTTSEISPFNHIWFVTKTEIDAHLAYFECLNDPLCDAGDVFPDYEIPPDFLSWPAESNENSQFADNLAPFFDYDSNGSYNPENGDHPVICGDFSSYCIWNGMGSETTVFDGWEVPLEIHTTIYGYAANSGAEFNTLFLKHKMIYRGSEPLENTYCGLWTDFDLGNYNDDFVGTEVQRSMFYVMNSDINDEGSTSGPGYGTDLPMMGVKVLAGPLADANGVDDEALYEEYYGNETTGFNDGIIDNERLGLHSAMHYYNASGPSAMQDPVAPPQYYNYARAIWRDGLPLKFGGIGYIPQSIGIFAKYAFPGESDPLNAGTNGIEPSYGIEGGWTEENENNEGGDRRMIGSTGPFTFEPGDVQYIDLAYIFARESHDEDETVFETLQRYADEVEGMYCESLPLIVLSEDTPSRSDPLTIYPNPARDEIAFDLPIAQATMTIFDSTGKEVKQAQLQGGNQRLGIENLESGVYLIRLETAQSIYHGKFVIEK